MAVFNPTAHLYHALVDIGSNGIRFSVTDLNIPTSRILPVVYQDRSAISLYDAQNDANGNKIPIPPTVIEQVIAALLRFKNTCRTFGVLDKNIKIVATEATRNATNRDDLLQQTQKTTGWTVDLLSKELEGRLGAMGIASSMEYVGGICIDMGGGSLQLTHVVTCPDGGIFPSPSVSYPYGAAALMKDMAELNDEEVMDLLSTITTDLKETMQVYLRDEQIQKATEDAGGFKLYLSGGGFRGWGHFLMSQKIGTLRHYPIPIVNGYTVDSATFFSNTFHYGTTIKSTSHRISHRRSSQIPAVQLVVEALSRTGIRISRVTFAQGGVREGLLYYGLPSSVRALAPVQSATITFAPPSAADFHDLLRSALPQDLINQGLILAVVNLLYAHEAASKDVRAVSALRCTTTGILASAHGLSHHDRAMLALVLCERWGGKIPTADIEFYNDLSKICGPQMRWWAKYVGRMAKGIAGLYPAGIKNVGCNEITITANFPIEKPDSASVKPEIDHCNIHIHVVAGDEGTFSLVEDWKDNLEKLGKRKHFGRDPQWGLVVVVKATKSLASSKAATTLPAMVDSSG